MGLILWGVILMVILLLDRWIVSAQRHNRRDYQRRKRVSQNS